MKRAVVASVLLLALGAILVWLWRSDGQESAGGIAAPSERTSQAAATTDAALGAPDDLLAESADVASVAEQRVEVASSERTTVDASAGAELLVRVIAEREGTPVRGVGVYLDSSSIPRAAYDRFFRASPLSTDEQGEVRLDVPAGLPLVIRCRGTAHHTARAVDVDPLAAGEMRVVPMSLYGGGDLVFHARVVDASTGLPIPGARIGVGPSTWSARDETDTAGRFALRARRWTSASVWIGAVGFADGSLVAGAGHDTPEGALLVPLRPVATLSLRLGGPVAAREGVRACVVIDRSEVVAAAHGVESPPRGVVDRDARRDDVGGSEWRDLPSGVPLWLELRKSGNIVRRSVEPLILDPGERREVEWLLGQVSTVSGRVLDQLGAPVVDCTVGLSAVPAEDDRFLAEVTDTGAYTTNVDPMQARSSTDSQGRFSFDAVEPGTWWVVTGIVPRSEGDRRGRFHAQRSSALEREPEWRAAQVATCSERVDVPRVPSALDVTLHASRGLYIGGRAVDPSGRAVKNSRVEATSLSAATCLVRVDDLPEKSGDGSFLIGPLAPGRYSLEVVLGSFRSDPVIAEAGDEGVTIRCVFESRAPDKLHHPSPF